jgi:hypothetical protein
MITAPDVFEVDEHGRYTPTVAVPWVQTDGVPTVLHVGRTLRYCPEEGWQVTTAKTPNLDPTWKPISKAAKAVKEAFAAAAAADNPAPGYYELIGPTFAGNPHHLGDFQLITHGSVPLNESPPRTSLYALGPWLNARDLPGILWSWDTADGRLFAAVRAEHLSH